MSVAKLKSNPKPICTHSPHLSLSQRLSLSLSLEIRGLAQLQHSLTWAVSFKCRGGGVSILAPTHTYIFHPCKVRVQAKQDHNEADVRAEEISQWLYGLNFLNLENY
jgi:hypothetical protein